MAAELSRIAAAMPLVAVLAMATAVRQGRRRAALNEALHELRRPLQALTLAAPEPSDSSRGLDGSLRMASEALERLDREINGGAAARSARTAFDPRALLESAVARWRRRAAMEGGSLTLSWRAGEATLRGDGEAISRAVDNLIANAIEHGGRRAVVEARRASGRLRVSVIDSGRGPRRCRPAAAKLAGRLAGRNRHGHGLRVVRRIAAAHGGEFRLLGSPRGTEARLELPLARSRDEIAGRAA